MKAPGLFAIQFKPRLATGARNNLEKSLTIFPSGGVFDEENGRFKIHSEDSNHVHTLILAKLLRE